MRESFINKKDVALFVIGMIITIIYLVLEQYNMTVASIFLGIFYPANYITNMFMHLQDPSFLNYGWIFTLIIDNYSLGVFLLISTIWLFILFKLLKSNNKKIKDVAIYIILFLYSLPAIIVFKEKIQYVILKAAGYYIEVGTGNVNAFLGLLSIIICGFFMLYLLERKYNFKFYCKAFIKYLLCLVESLLAIFISITVFVETVRATNVELLDQLSYILYFMSIGFVLFTIIEVIKVKIFKKLKMDEESD